MNIKIKTKEQIEVMKEGGAKLSEVKKSLREMIAPGVSAYDIEQKAQEVIKRLGGQPSFTMVPGYSWATCINTNDGIVHGIPDKKLVFKSGDIVSVDVGVYFKGFHTDTSFSILLGKDPFKEKFLQAGELALKRALEQVLVGQTIYDISHTIEQVISDAGFVPVRSLTGHGVGASLHEDPYIPCFIPKGFTREKAPEIKEGMVLAVEVMYAQGTPDLVTDEDGWTIRTKEW